MITIHLLLLILALVCFFVAALGVATARWNLTALGLFFWLLAVVLVGKW